VRHFEILEVTSGLISSGPGDEPGISQSTTSD